MQQVTYMKLVKAGDTELREDIADYDGENSALLQHYVTASCSDSYCEEYAEESELDIVEHTTVATVLVLGGSEEVRCYSNTVAAVVDKAGNVWMNADLYEEVFC